MDGGKKAKKWRNFEDEEKRASISANVYLKEAAAAMWRNSRRHTAIILGGGRCRQHEYIIWWFKRKKSSSLCFPPFSWMVILCRSMYLVWDERISGCCVINSITGGILRVMAPNSFRDFYTLGTKGGVLSLPYTTLIRDVILCTMEVGKIKPTTCISLWIKEISELV